MNRRLGKEVVERTCCSGLVAIIRVKFLQFVLGERIEVVVG